MSPQRPGPHSESSRRMWWLGSHSCMGVRCPQGLLAQPVQATHPALSHRVVNPRKQFPIQVVVQTLTQQHSEGLTSQRSDLALCSSACPLFSRVGGEAQSSEGPRDVFGVGEAMGSLSTKTGVHPLPSAIQAGTTPCPVQGILQCHRGLLHCCRV